MKFLNILLILSVALLSSCQDKDDSTSISEELGARYSNYRLMDDHQLLIGDTINMKLGDSVAIYLDLDKNPIILAENYTTISIGHNRKGGFLITAQMTGFIKAAVMSDIGQFIFYIKVEPVESEIIVFEYPRYTIDVNNQDLKDSIEDQLAILTPKLLDTYDLKYTNVEGRGTVLCYNRRTPSDSTTGVFKSDDTHLKIIIENQLKYDFTLVPYQKSDSVIYTHYLKQDFTTYFQAKYPDEQINEVTASSDCIKYK